jgi:hypothetical protein
LNFLFAEWFFLLHLAKTLFAKCQKNTIVKQFYRVPKNKLDKQASSPSVFICHMPDDYLPIVFFLHSTQPIFVKRTIFFPSVV